MQLLVEYDQVPAVRRFTVPEVWEDEVTVMLRAVVGSEEYDDLISAGWRVAAVEFAFNGRIATMVKP